MPKAKSDFKKGPNGRFHLFVSLSPPPTACGSSPTLCRCPCPCPCHSPSSYPNSLPAFLPLAPLQLAGQTFLICFHWGCRWLFASKALCVCVCVRVCATLQLATNRITKPTKKQHTHTHTHHQRQRTLCNSQCVSRYKWQQTRVAERGKCGGRVWAMGNGKCLGIFRKIHLTIS